jgi:hypothetical protein
MYAMPYIYFITIVEFGFLCNLLSAAVGENLVSLYFCRWVVHPVTTKCTLRIMLGLSSLPQAVGAGRLARMWGSLGY